MDTYLVVTIPDIWSPIYHPHDKTNFKWSAYDFKWIKNLGTNMIKEVLITCGNQTLQRYSGNYIESMVERDFTNEKKDLFSLFEIVHLNLSQIFVSKHLSNLGI